MSVSFRIFVIDNENLIQVSKKNHHAFIQRQEPVLKQFANQRILIATVAYILKNSLPNKIIRIDTMKIRVRSDGSMDEESYNEWGEFEANKWAKIDSNEMTETFPKSKSRIKGTNIIDAKSAFDRSREKNLNPELSMTVLKRIKIKVLGKTQ